MTLGTAETVRRMVETIETKIGRREKRGGLESPPLESIREKLTDPVRLPGYGRGPGTWRRRHPHRCRCSSARWPGRSARPGGRPRTCRTPGTASPTHDWRIGLGELALGVVRVQVEVDPTELERRTGSEGPPTRTLFDSHGQSHGRAHRRRREGRRRNRDRVLLLVEDRRAGSDSEADRRSRTSRNVLAERIGRAGVVDRGVVVARCRASR